MTFGDVDHARRVNPGRNRGGLGRAGAGWGVLGRAGAAAARAAQIVAMSKYNNTILGIILRVAGLAAPARSARAAAALQTDLHLPNQRYIQLNGCLILT